MAPLGPITQLDSALIYTCKTLLQFFKTMILVLIYISGTKVCIWASIFIFSSVVT